MNEIWEDIIGFEGAYQVSSIGRVKSVGRTVAHSSGKSVCRLKSKLLSPADTGNGYLFVALWKGNKQKFYLIHRLMAQQFITPVTGKEYVNHIDGNKRNNTIENLEWCTKSENAIHAYAKGLIKKRFYGDANRAVQLINTKTGDIVTSIKELSEKLNVSYYSLQNQFSGRSKNLTDFKVYNSEEVLCES